MRDILIALDDTDKELYYSTVIREGENKASRFLITLTDEFLGYKYLISFQLNDNLVYTTPELVPVNDVIEYEVTNSLTFEHGSLRMELQAFDVNNTLVKSAVIVFKIAHGIEGIPIEIPSDYEVYMQLIEHYMDNEIYDVGLKKLNVYDMSNMDEGVVNKIFTATERAKLAGIIGSISAVASTYPIRDTDANLDTNGIDFNLTPSTIGNVEGHMQWNAEVGTVEIGLKGGNATLQVGQESFIYVRNSTAVTIPDGSVVAVIGSTGQRPDIILADSNGTLEATYVIGVTTQAITSHSNGYVTTIGVVHDLNTNAFNEGDALWLSTVPGEMTNVMPILPSIPVFIGWCLSKSGTGNIYVNPIRRQTASEVLILDSANYFTGTNVESALAEAGLKVKGIYDDLPPAPFIASKVGANAPTLETFKGNIMQYSFDATNDEVFGATEITHQYKEGSNLLPHVHWANNGTEAVPKSVKWELEYSIGNSSGVFGASQVINIEVVIPSNTVDRTQMVTALPTITGTGLQIGAYIVWRFRRIPAVGTAPVLNPFALALGIHMEMDTFGSTSVSTK